VIGKLEVTIPLLPEHKQCNCMPFIRSILI